MSTGTSFINEVKARIKGDEAGVIAAKNERKATSAVNSQLAALKARLVNEEFIVDDKEEALKVVKYPTEVIVDGERYVRNVKNASDSLEAAKEAVEATKEAIAYFEALLASFA